MKSKRRVLYGEANYRTLREENGYYVDKTAYLRLIERYHSPVFLRPRRFGKSFWCSTMSTYYDVRLKDRFEALFGDTDIGRNPTSERNSCLCLHLDFSVVGVSTRDIHRIEESFNDHINLCLDSLVQVYRHWFEDSVVVDMGKNASYNLDRILGAIRNRELPPLFITIDEYDNFANQLIVSRKDDLYHDLIRDDSFLKTFFKTLKKGKGQSSIRRIFITGVLPITIDELASGYNIADFLTLDPEFEAMLGFTQDEVHHLLDRVYLDHGIDPATRDQVEKVIESNYNGYRFLGGEPLYHTTILMFFLEKFYRFKKIPEFLTDPNLKTDLSWVKRLTASNPDQARELVSRLTIHNRIGYNKILLTEKFNMSQFFHKDFYPISFYYLGMLTRLDDFNMCLPNMNMKAIFTEYFNELHNISVSGPYSEMMAAFAQDPDLPRLFADYWRLYITQFPEAVFQKVNENFYRTTFYDLCRQYLSHLYLWRMESSLATGRTDLEMAGQFHTKFAGDRYLMEFKYLSNARTREKGIDIPTFQAPGRDIEQLAAYARERRGQAPQERIRAFLIFCFGKRGFRIFTVK